MDEKSSALISLLLGLIIATSLIAIDQAYRIFNPHLTVWINTHQIRWLLVIGVSLAFLPKTRQIIWIYAVMILFLLIQLIHFSYFGTRIFPIEISLFFSHSRETLQIFSTMLSLTLAPLLICASAFALICLACRQLNHRARSRYAGILLVLAFLFPAWPIIKIIHQDKVGRLSHDSIGDRDNHNDDLWFSTQKMLLFYLMYTLPQEVLGNHALTQPIPSPLPIAKPRPHINIVFIMGESLTRTHMSAYGYDRPTTPFLNSLKHHRQIIFKKGISAGVSTDVSLPMFFNMALRPDSSKAIASGHRNLFMMAQKNGFETYFISAQSSFHLGLLRGYLLPAYISHYADANLLGGAHKKSVFDEKLADYLDTSVDFSQPTFLVLHERGSHAEYIHRYPANAAVFQTKHGSFQQNQIDTYDNSVRYTDAVLERIVQLVQQKTQRPTYLIFTADHGESLGNHGIFGHENLSQPEQHQVPIVIIGINGADLRFIHRKNREDINQKFMSHYELSQIVAYLLGYSITDFSTQSTGYFVTGNTLSGLAGYESINFNALNREKFIIESL
jgi:glucan phosphoethanolaminetransferase (alkaline phosphatase superfamily)